MNRFARIMRRGLVAAVVVACCGGVVHAQSTVTWMATSPTGPADGNGTWNASNTNWWDGSAKTWTAGNIAWFGNGALTATGTVTVSGSQNAGGITFGAYSGTSRYLLTTGTIGLTDNATINLSGAATGPANNTSNLAGFTTINSAFVANNLTVAQRAGEASAVALNLGGTNTLTGTLLIGNATALSITNARSLGTADVNVNSGGSLSINASGTFANNFLLTGQGASSLNYGTLRFASGTAATVLTGTITFGGGDIRIGGQGTIAGQNSNVVIANALTGTVGTLSFIQTGTIQLLAKTAYTTTSGTIFRQTGSLTLDAGNETLPAGTVLTFPNNSATKLVLGGTANGAMTQTVNMGSPGTTSTTVVGGASGTSTLVVTGMNASTNVAFSLGGAGSNENNVGLTVDMGAATLYWTGGANTYTGPTQVLSGRLAIGPSNGGTGGRLSPSTSVAISSGATLLFNNNGGSYSGAVANSISGAGVLQLASGTLTLTGSSSYSGGTVLQSSLQPGQGGGSGVLVVGNPDALGSSISPLTLNGTGGVDFGGFSVQQGAVSVTSTSSGVSIGNGTLTASSLSVSPASGTVSITANLVSPGAFTKSGGHLLSISGSNTLTGTTRIDAGTLSLGNADALGGGGDIRFGGGTLQFTGSGTPDVASQVKNSTSAMTFDTNGQDVTFTNSLGASNTGGLTKVNSSGTLTLAANNTYAGTTTVNGGVLRVAGSGTAFGSGTVSLGTAAGATLDINGFTQSVGALSGGAVTGGSVVLSGGTLAVGSDNTSTTYSGNFTGALAGTLAKQGLGILTLNGTTSTLAGISLQAGQLVVSPTSTSSFALGTISRSVGSGLSLQPGTGSITVDAGTAVTNGMIGPWAITGTGANLTYATHSSGTIVAYSASGTAATAVNLPNNASANFLLQSATGAVPATVSANTIRFTGAANTTTNTSSSFTVNGLMNAGSGTWTINSGTITIGSAGELVVATNTRAVSIGSVIRESGTVAGLTFISQGGALTLSATTANSFTGPINVTGGNLSLNASGTYGAVNLENTRTLTANLSGAQRIGSITGVGSSFTKAGTGTTSLLDTSTYTGATSIQRGVVEIASIANIGMAGGLGNPTAANGTIGVGSGTTGATLRYVGSGTSTTDRVINMAGTTGGATLDASGAGPLMLTSALTATGTGAKTLTLTGTSTAANAIGVIPDAGSSTVVSVDKSGSGLWRLTGASTYSGQLRVLDGTVVVAANVAGGNSPFGSNTNPSAYPLVGGTAASLTGTAALLLADGVTVERGFTVAASGSGSQQVVVLGGSGTGFSAFSNNSATITLGRSVTLQAGTSGTVSFKNIWQASGTTPTITIGTPGNAGTVVLDSYLPGTNNPNDSVPLTAVNVVLGTARVTNSNRIDPTTPVTIGSMLGAATLDLDTYSQSLASLTFTGTGGIVANGTLRLANAGSAAAVTVTGSGHQISSAVALDDAATFTVNAASRLLVSSSVSDGNTAGRPLTKLGAGTLELTGASTYTGTTTAGNGVVRFDSAVAGASAQALGTGEVVNLGVASTSAGELDYFAATSGTLSKNVFALGSGRNRIRNSGGATLELSGTLTKNATILELAGGTFIVSGQITGSSPKSDFLVNGATVTLTNTNNDYNGPTYVYGDGTLTLGASNVIPGGSALLLGGTGGGDTGSGTIVTGTFTDTVASLTTSALSGTVGITVSGATAGGLTMGNLTLGGSADTLALSLSGLTAARYPLLTYTGLLSGTFDVVTGLSGAPTYSLVYGSGSSSSIDLQMRATQAATLPYTQPTSGTVSAFVSTNVSFSGTLANSTPTGGAALAVSLSGTGGQLAVNGLAASTGSTVAAGSSATVTGTIATGGTLGSQTWSVVNTDATALGSTTATASGVVNVFAHGTPTLSGSTVNFGYVLVGTSTSRSVTVSNGVLGSPAANTAGITWTSGSLTGGFTGGGASSLGVIASGSGATYAYQLYTAFSGSAGGGQTFSFADDTSILGNGSLGSQTVSLAGTVLDPATPSFTALSATTSWVVNVGSFSPDSGSHTTAFAIYNLFSNPSYTADLMLDSVTPVGTEWSSLSIDLTPGAFGSLVAGGTSGGWLATLTSAVPGEFSNTYQLNFLSAKNGDSLGGPQSMTLTVTGVILSVPEPGALALAGIGAAGAAWALRRRKAAGRAT